MKSQGTTTLNAGISMVVTPYIKRKPTVAPFLPKISIIVPITSSVANAAIAA